MWPFSLLTRKPHGNTSHVTVRDPGDLAMLRCMANCTVKGKMVLPSGFTIPPPPPGKVWHVDRGVVTMKDDT